jgi:hypothetical protein
MSTMVRRALVAFALVALAACGASEAAGPPPPTGTIGGVGELPEPLGVGTIEPSSTETTEFVAPPPPPTTPRQVGVIGESVDGNRVIVIGDSILASTARRYGGNLCEALVPLDWAVEVDAETGRFIEFLDQVLDRRLRPAEGVDWDAAVIGLGNNFDGDVDGFTEQLDEALDRLTPRPVVLLTLTERRQDQVRLNEMIRSLPATRPEVVVVDWAAISASEPSMLQADRLHLSEAGRDRLAYEIAAVLGSPPVTTEPECLSTEFDDDSASRGDGVVTPPGSGTTTTRPRPTTTTTRPPTTSVTTTTRPTTTTGAGATSSTSATTTAAPSTTAAPTTAATTSAAPTTAATTTAAPTGTDA